MTKHVKIVKEKITKTQQSNELKHSYAQENHNSGLNYYERLMELRKKITMDDVEQIGVGAGFTYRERKERKLI